MLTTLPEEEQQQDLQAYQRKLQPQPQPPPRVQQQRDCFCSSGSRSTSSICSSLSEDVRLKSSTSSRSTSCEVFAPRDGLGSGSGGGGASSSSFGPWDMGSMASSGPPCNAKATIASLGRRRCATITKRVPERAGGREALEHRYRVSLQEVGRGGFGAVFIAEDREVPRRQVAVKKVFAAGLGKRQAFDREVDVMKQMDHPSICRILETYVGGQTLYIVMEPCSGGDVFDRVSRRGPLGEEVAADVIRQVASALQYAHNFGIAHRDIKPENVCFCSADPADTSIKVIDWGTGFRFREGTMRSFAGSFAYAGPETRNPIAGYTEACDLWSLGVMTYVVLSGLPPFWGSSEKQIKDMDAERYPLCGGMWHKVSDDAKELIRSLIKVRPELRLSARDVVVHPWLRARTPLSNPQEIARQLFCNMRRFANSSCSLATFATVVAKHLDPQNLYKLRQLFDSIDSDCDGVISFDELMKGFEAAFGTNSYESQDLEVVFAQLDLDGSGAISYTEFLAAALGTGFSAKDEALLAAFNDLDATDAIRHELSHVSANFSPVEGDDAQSELTIQEWLHRVREPHRRKNKQSFPFEAHLLANVSSTCLPSFFRKACETLSGRGLGRGRPSATRSSIGQAFARPSASASASASAYMMQHAVLLMR